MSRSKMVGIELDLESGEPFVVAYRFDCGHRAPALIQRRYDPDGPAAICLECEETDGEASLRLRTERMVRVVRTAARNPHRLQALASALLELRLLLEAHPVPQAEVDIQSLMARRDAIARALHRVGAMYWPSDSEEDPDHGLSA